MSWSLLLFLVALLGLSVGVLAYRRHERRRTREVILERAQARERGTHKGRLLYPNIDISRCIGCGSCVDACPEAGVLQMVHGQAMVVHGARCVSHGLCAQACPVGAIALEFADIQERKDIPALTDKFESTLTPGVFLAGEITGYALIRTAISHGTIVADEVARRLKGAPPPPDECFDLVIIGSGPAGLACGLQAKLNNLSFLMLEQAELGGTVAKYPRRKLVMTQPVALPAYGKLERASYAKEELLEIWTEVIERNALPIRTGVEFLGVSRDPNGLLRVHTSSGDTLARNVCLALGRRGTPNRLGVPGEELSKVSYSLLDAEAYEDRGILVVGGGDSAIEAALGLADQPGNRVTLSYRKREFSRLRARNQERITAAVERGDVEVLFESEVLRIDPQSVTLRIGGRSEQVLANDDVFVFAGGKPPFELLQASGISFDPEQRAQRVAVTDQQGGLFKGLSLALGFALVVLAWALAFRGYYSLPLEARHDAPQHDWLKPAGGAGLAAGILALACVMTNLAYLARRSPRFTWIPGSLRRWMTLHVATGIGAFLLVLVHGAMAPKNTVGGHAFYALAILIATGAIGRYFYAFVPRAANGRELDLDEIESRMTQLSGEWDRVDPAFAERVRKEMQRLQTEGRWKGSFLARVKNLIANQRMLRESLIDLRRQAHREGLSHDQIEALLELARGAQRTALMAAHYDDLRALLSTWRWVHRWTALAMVLLVLRHIWMALRFGGLLT